MRGTAAALRAVPRLASALPRLAGSLSGLPRALRRRAAALPRTVGSLPGRLRQRLLIAAAAAVLLACGYLFLLRDSAFVSVEKVSVSGLTLKDGERVRRELVAAAREMTTLHVRPDELEAAVADHAAIRSLEVSTDFPHSLRIVVEEHRPVAIVSAGGARIPVAGDGTLLRRVPIERPLPVIEARRPPTGSRLWAPRSLRFLSVIAAAPTTLRGKLAAVSASGERGLVVRVRRGPELIFGDRSRLGAKWTAAARVLADPASRGTRYVDVRLPERPAAGGPPAPAPPPGGAPAAPVQVAPTSPPPPNPQPTP